MIYNNATAPFIVICTLLMLPGRMGATISESSPPQSTVSCNLSDKHNTPWNLHLTLQEMRQIHPSFLEHTGLSPSAVSGGLADEYHAEARYSLEEFANVIVSAVDLARTPGQEEFTRITAGGDVVCDVEAQTVSSEALVVYVDPTCGHCNDIITLIQSARAVCPTFPPIAYRLLPSTDSLALDASAYLELVRQRIPHHFCSAVRSFLAILPEHGEAIEGLWADYRAFIPAAVTKVDFDRARGDIVNKSREFPASSYGAPLVIYRGRVLGKKGAFNALRSPNTLMQVILLINLWEKTREADR